MRKREVHLRPVVTSTAKSTPPRNLYPNKIHQGEAVKIEEPKTQFMWKPNHQAEVLEPFL
jgi:hypothetical protein